MLAVQQICEKWQYLCNTFATATKKMENKEALTYLQNSLYQRLFFLRSFIPHETNCSTTTKSETSRKLLRKCDYKNNVKVNETASEEMLNKVGEILTNKENQVCFESASVLNSLILSHKDPRVERLCLQFILKSIKEFVSTCQPK